MQNYKATIWQWVFLVGAVFMFSCREQERPIIKIKPLCLSNADKVEIMNIAEDVLVRLHFDIEKFDIEQGIIRTRPLVGAQFFELWRNDNVGGYNAAEANLHTIRRTVELNFMHQGQDICITSEVQTERLDLPEQEITSSGRAYHLFSRSGLSMQRIKLNPKQEAGMSWVNLGMDSELATEILRRIKGQIATISEPSAPGTTKSAALSRPRR